MVVGNGLLAKAFKRFNTSNEVVIFASGVSNSTETNTIEFKRELQLLKDTVEQFPLSKLVYFSTTSIHDSAVNLNAYVQHKLQMEAYIKKNSQKYLIFRISNVVGSFGNKNTLLNFLVTAIKTGQRFDVWQQAERNLIDIEDVTFIISKILQQPITNKTINIATKQSVLVTSIVKEIEVYLKKKAIINSINKGAAIRIDTSFIDSYLNEIALKKGRAYPI